MTKVKEAKTYRPEQIAKALGLSGKVVRAHLRKEFPRDAEAKNTAWVLDEAQAKATMQHFKSLRPKSDDGSDES